MGGNLSQARREPPNARKRNSGRPSRQAVNRPPVPTKASSIEFAKKARVQDAVETILTACFDHWSANEVAVLSGVDPEAVHQMRVGLRRMRAAFSDFKEVIPAAQLGWLKRDTKWLVINLSAARDWDVFLAELLHPVINARAKNSSLERLRVAAEYARKKGHLRAQRAVRSPRYAALIHRIRSWLSSRAWCQKGEGESLDEPAVKLASPLLRKRHYSVLDRGREFTDLSPLERHKFRIALKKLRYTAEFFSSLFPAKGQKAYLHSLGVMQDSLGHMNDVLVAEHLLQQLSARRGSQSPGLSMAIGMVIGWHAHNAISSEQDAIENWREFCRCDVFW